jgi:hypothetical protein
VVPRIVFEVLDRLALDDVKGAVRWMLFRSFYRGPMRRRGREVEGGSDETEETKESAASIFDTGPVTAEFVSTLGAWRRTPRTWQRT